MNGRRAKSLELMNLLQPFTQSGVLKAVHAGNIVSEYMKGNNKPLQDFILDPDIPGSMIPLTQKIKNFI